MTGKAVARGFRPKQNNLHLQVVTLVWWLADVAEAGLLDGFQIDRDVAPSHEQAPSHG